MLKDISTGSLVLQTEGELIIIDALLGLPHEQ